MSVAMLRNWNNQDYHFIILLLANPISKPIHLIKTEFLADFNAPNFKNWIIDKADEFNYIVPRNI